MTETCLANGQTFAGKNPYDQEIQINDKSSVGQYFGPEAPDGKESNRIGTLPGKGWFTILRLYGPLEGHVDGSWKTSDIEIA